jgi:tetratricopeptide (TPR) repeat protein
MGNLFYADNGGRSPVMKKKLLLFLFITLFGFLAGTPGTTQTVIAPGLESGIQLYSEGKWVEAVTELLGAWDTAGDTAEKAEILYWIALAKISAGEYSAALQDLDALELLAPEGNRSWEISYHRGRALYYLGWYDEALIAFTIYANRISETTEGEVSREASAFFWIGECLYALGQFEQAAEQFTLIVEKYPQTAKYEAAGYRLALIKQKKIEAEQRYAVLEANLREANAALKAQEQSPLNLPPSNPQGISERTAWILSLKASALDLRDNLMGQLNDDGMSEPGNSARVPLGGGR